MIETPKQTAECPALHDSVAGLGSEPDGSIPQPHNLSILILYLCPTYSPISSCFSTSGHLIFPMNTAGSFHLILY